MAYSAAVMAAVFFVISTSGWAAQNTPVGQSTGPIIIQGQGTTGAGAVGVGAIGPASTANLSPKTKPIDVRRQQVMQILRLIQPNQHNVRIAVAALIEAGKENLPILQELKDHTDRLVGNDEPANNTYATTDGVEFTDNRPREERAADLRKLRLEAVTAAINQFTQGYDPVRAIEKWAAAQGGADPTARSAQPQPFKDDDLAKLFPDYAFSTLMFRSYPVAMMPPEPYKMHNIFAIDRKGKVEAMTTKEELETWFRAHLPRVKDEPTAKSVMRAWLACASQLITDGFYRFTIPEESITTAKARELRVTGRLEVPPGSGNQGKVDVTIPFDADGRLGSVSQEVNLKPGMRPICQSTKLLDPDPIVRRMAEDSLRIMGADAFPYLIDQRSRFGPDLQEAVDRLMLSIINGE
jgi:hypothetical protein